jgi:splicing factor 1
MSEASKINPEIKIPPNFRPAFKEINIYIPQKDHPGYSFIGLILGPRGCTQKRLEYETCTKVAIRGKGAAKHTEQRTVATNESGCNMETHINISANSWDKVDAAIELIEPLLIFIEEENIHKRNEMLQIAKNNGSWQLNQFENDRAGELILIKKMSGPLGSDRKGVSLLPEDIKKKMDEQYRRDIAKVKGFETINVEEQFEQFMSELNTKDKHSRHDWCPENKICGNYLDRSLNKPDKSLNKGIHRNEMNDAAYKASPYGGYSPCFPD